jgi:hypothetical protein
LLLKNGSDDRSLTKVPAQVERMVFSQSAGAEQTGIMMHRPSSASRLVR